MTRALADWVAVWFGASNNDPDPRALVSPLLTFNHAPSAASHEGDVEVLVIEQQGVWLWGRASSGAYVERENQPGVPWRDTGEDTESFWLHHAAFEATWSMPANRSAQMLGRDSVDQLVERTSPLPCGDWTWPGTRQQMYYRGASLVMVCDDGDDHWVVAAAPEETGLSWLDDLELDWDEHDSRLA